jgi:hypothetical protein
MKPTPWTESGSPLTDQPDKLDRKPIPPVHIADKNRIDPITAKHGETIWEAFGAFPGPDGINHSVAYVELKPGKHSLEHFHPLAQES